MRRRVSISSVLALLCGLLVSAGVLAATCEEGSAVLSGGCPDPVTLRRNGRDQSVTRTITAMDGGEATVGVAGIDIDRKKPTVKVKGVKNGKTYRHARKIRCKADSLSGMHRCKVTTSRHRQRDGDVVVRYRVKSVDKAGNKSFNRGKYHLNR